MDQEENKILVVDDQRANRLAIEHILKPLNLTVIQAESGKEALKELLNHDFAVVLMDVVMPDIDGYETTRLIRKSAKFQKLPVVMVTSHDKKDQYLLAYEAGAVDYITKPVEPIVLVNKVQQFVELHSQRLRAQKSRRQQEFLTSRMQVLLNSAGDGILGLDRCGKITFANPKASELLNTDRTSLILRPFSEFLKLKQEVFTSPVYTFIDDYERPQLRIVKLLKDRESQFMEQGTWRRADGTEFAVEYSCEITRDVNSDGTGGVVTFQDISEKKLIEDKLIKLANFDPLTSLANRAYFHDTLVRAMAQSRRRDGSLGLLLLDLDHFKVINDTMGHDAGDKILQVVSDRLREAIRVGDLAARLGGDEFAIILYDITSLAGVIKIAEKLVSTINSSILLQGKEISMSTSIGISIYEDNDVSLEELVKAADVALYAAKADGRNTYRFFEQEMQQRASEKSSLQAALRGAIHQNQLTVYYQPKLSAEGEKVVGLEALVRWITEDGSLLEPKDFIPIAEESGLIHQLGEWVVNAVCKQVAIWQDLPSFNDLTVSINVSPHQLRTESFHRLLGDAMETYRVIPHNIGVELTETAIMKSPETIATELNALHDLGVKIAIEDFGSGYSSLYYLKHLPIDILKIDQRFINDINEGIHDKEIIKLVIAMAHTLKIQVIAEGVETSQQLGFLVAAGCDLVQGRYFSEPLTPLIASKMLAEISSYYTPQFKTFHKYLTDKSKEPLQSSQLH